MDLNDFFTALDHAHGPSLAEAGKTLTWDCSNFTSAILADEGHLNVCLTSLLLNALLHGGNDITLSAHSDPEGNIEIHLADNGTLHDHVELAELYKPFVVGGDIEKRGTGGGLGLGLPLTRKLIELHGGEFEVHAAPNATTAVIRLPAWRSAS